MGEADRYQEYRIKKQRFTLGQQGNALMWLFVFNVVFFLIPLTIKAAVAVNDNSDAIFYSKVLNWFQFPASLQELVKRPWTMFTYMFSDVVLFRVISNMLWLWAFGSILQSLTGNKKLFPVYLYGGLSGAIFFILANHLIPADRSLIDSANLLGANAAIMSVAVAATMVAPDYRFFRHIRGGVPVWVFLIVYIAIDIAGVAAQSAAIPVSHLGGALAGFVFIYLLRRRIDGSVWMNKFYYWFINLFNPDKGNEKDNIKERVFYNTGSRSPYKRTANLTEQRIDEILDKINQKGYDYLTKEEKEILKRASED